MDTVEYSEVCRLCLELTESFEPLTDTDRNILKDLVPDIVIDPLADLYLCSTCSEQLLRSCEFKRKSLMTRNIPGQSKEVLDNSSSTKLNVKQEATCQSCCLCHKQDVSDSSMSSEVLSDMLVRCFPELENIHSISKPNICTFCLQELELFYNMISTCLTVEDKIQNYIANNELDNNFIPNLRDVAMEIDTDIVKKEMEICIDENSNGSLFKYEPEIESEESCEDEPAVSTDNLDSSSLDFYEQALLLVLLYRRRRNKKRLRRFWISPFSAERYKKGMFYNSYRGLREDDQKFSEHFGLSVKSFDELLEIIGEDITGKYTMMRRCVPPDEKLALTLRYLKTGLSMIKLHHAFRLGTSTISNIIQTVCRSLCRVVHKRYVPTPDNKRWLEISERFERTYNFPHCVGAIGSVCDSDYRFLHFEVGSSNIEGWKQTEFYKKITTNALNLPEPAELKGTDIVAPYAFIGDNTFGSASYLLRPFSGRNMNEKQKVFNYRLSRARRQIDSAFAIVSNKWKILQKRFDVSMDFAVLIIRSCCVLHNFLLDREGYDFEDTLTIEGLCDMDWYWKQGGRLTAKVRDAFAEYFVTEAGQVPWQLGKISSSGSWK